MNTLYKIFCFILAIPGFYLLVYSFSNLAPGMFVVRFGIALLLCFPAVAEFGLSRFSRKDISKDSSSKGISSGKASIGFLVVGVLILIGVNGQQLELFLFKVFGFFSMIYSLKELLMDMTDRTSLALASVTPLWLIAFLLLYGLGNSIFFLGGIVGLSLYVIILIRALFKDRKLAEKK